MRTCWTAVWPGDDSLMIHQQRDSQQSAFRLNQWHGRIACELTRLLLDDVSRASMSADARWNQALTLGNLVVSHHQVRGLMVQAMLVHQALEHQLKITQDCLTHGIDANSLTARCLFAIRNSTDHCPEIIVRKRISERDLLAHEDSWNAAIDCLQHTGLIQLIDCPDGRRYLDANPLPHAHLWIDPLGILVDCDESTAARFTRSAAGPVGLQSRLGLASTQALQTTLIPARSAHAHADPLPASRS